MLSRQSVDFVFSHLIQLVFLSCSLERTAQFTVTPEPRARLHIMASPKTPESEKDLALPGGVQPEPTRDSEKYAHFENEDGEVFKKTADGVDYRTNGW